jgi:hypothetical protein
VRAQQREQAPFEATIEGRVIFARRHRTDLLRARGDAVVLEGLPAKGLAVGVPARFVNNPEIKNVQNGRTLDRVQAALLR